MCAHSKLVASPPPPLRDAWKLFIVVICVAMFSSNICCTYCMTEVTYMYLVLTSWRCRILCVVMDTGTLLEVQKVYIFLFTWLFLNWTVFWQFHFQTAEWKWFNYTEDLCDCFDVHSCCFICRCIHKAKSTVMRCLHEKFLSYIGQSVRIILQSFLSKSIFWSYCSNFLINISWKSKTKHIFISEDYHSIEGPFINKSLIMCHW